MKLGENMIPDLAWEDYWQGLYNRLERGFSWILISIGAIILAGYAIVNLVNALYNDTSMPILIKFGLFALLIGLATLLISVIRERWFMGKNDPYKEIKR